MHDAAARIRLARLGTFVVLAALGTGGVEAGKGAKRDPDWVLAQVEQLVREDTPYCLRARLELVAEDGSIVPGVYERLWASSDRWRQEIRIADYRDSEGVSGERAWSSRSLPFRPWNVRLAVLAFDLDMPLKGARPSFRKVPARDGRPDLACAGVRGAWVCVDAGSGALVLREAPSFRLRYDYGPLRQFERGPWPETVRLLDEDREIGRLLVERLEPLSAADAERIQPPEGVEIVMACKKTLDVKIIPATKAKPKYPEALRQMRVSGYAILQVTIDENGEVKDMQPLRATHPGFVEPAREAVGKWRYQPALCDGKPRKTQRDITVQFHLD